jgi:hypothetical protein
MEVEFTHGAEGPSACQDRSDAVGGPARVSDLLVPLAEQVGHLVLPVAPDTLLEGDQIRAQPSQIHPDDLSPSRPVGVVGREQVERHHA